MQVYFMAFAMLFVLSSNEALSSTQTSLRFSPSVESHSGAEAVDPDRWLLGMDSRQNTRKLRSQPVLVSL